MTAVAEGEAVITVKTVDGGYTAECTVTVEKPAVPATGVTLDRTEATLKIGDVLTLTATVTPYDATDKSVTWSSRRQLPSPEKCSASSGERDQ